MRRLIESFAVSAIYLLVTMSCEVLDDDVNKHTSGTGKVYVSLSEVAEILAALPLEQ